jgi:hypothetical protein
MRGAEYAAHSVGPAFDWALSQALPDPMLVLTGPWPGSSVSQQSSGARAVDEYRYGTYRVACSLT